MITNLYGFPRQWTIWSISVWTVRFTAVQNGGNEIARFGDDDVLYEKSMCTDSDGHE